MNQNQESIKVATDFSKTPGSRYPSEGNYSGEEFRTSLLHPKLCGAIQHGNILVVDLDGTSGFGTSFLEEAFGGLVRENGLAFDEIETSMKLVSEEEPNLIEEIVHYMRQAELERGKDA